MRGGSSLSQSTTKVFSSALYCLSQSWLVQLGSSPQLILLSPALGHSSQLSWGHPDNGEAASAMSQDVGSIAWTAREYVCILPLDVQGLDISLFALLHCEVKCKKGKCPCLEIQMHFDIKGMRKARFSCEPPIPAQHRAGGAGGCHSRCAASLQGFCRQDPLHKAKPVSCSGNRLPTLRCQDNLAVPLAGCSPCRSEQAGLTKPQADEPSENGDQKVVLLSFFLSWNFTSPVCLM